MGHSDLATAIREFEKKFTDKSGHKWQDRAADPKKGKYTFIDKNYEDEEEVDAAQGGSTSSKVKYETDKEDSPAPIESRLPVPTQNLLKLIFNEDHFDAALRSIGYDSDELPLGKLGKQALRKGFEHLQNIADLLNDISLAQTVHSMSFPAVRIMIKLCLQATELIDSQAIESLTNQYYSTIPVSTTDEVDIER